MDDFGSGYSSLGQLARLPVDIIKIDRSLVQDLGTSRAGTASTARTLITAVTSIAATLGMTTVAEGIETAEQHAAVVELGCTHAQGYLFARPAPAHEVWKQVRGTSFSLARTAAGRRPA
jgi:EAL domain-containing protein (putative c-di-GMP-specific phosphodiesterase class I)